MADFGSDVSVFPDLDPAFAPLTGQRVVSEAIAKRLTTPRGSLAYAPDYGTDVRSYLNDAVTQAKLNLWKREIQRECEKDERILSAAAALSYDSPTTTLKISLSLTGADGPFALVLVVTAVSLSILDAG